ncbi:MAG: alpha-galactosidase [Verrucomicrobiota bacterium]
MRYFSKRFRFWLPWAWLAMGLAPAETSRAAEPVAPEAVAAAADPQAAALWVQKNWESGSSKDLPLSFEMGGAKSGEFLARWEKTSEEKNGIRILRWKDLPTGLELRVELTVHRNWPVVAWTAFLQNTGPADSPELRRLLAADIFFEGSGLTLHGIEGDSNSARSFACYEWQPKPDTVRMFGPGKSGKSTSGANGWPYFNLAGPGEKGRILVLGWPGQWSATFTPGNEGLRWVAGQEKTHFKLRPGESVRFPSVTLMFWQGGDWIMAQNLWRRWYREAVLPHPPGGRQTALWNIQTTLDSSQIPRIQKMLDAGIQPDLCWMDAGGGWWVKPEPRPFGAKDREDSSEAFLNTTGFWEPDPKKYPEGFRPFGDWARQHGMKAMLWVEPERIGYTNSAANASSEPVLATRHPEWLLPGGSHGSYFNLGDPAALAWLQDHLTSVIQKEKLDWYREDFNGAGPYEVWRNHDALQKEKAGFVRMGLTENFYIQGHLALWDSLRARNPGLLLDSCASGGRRNDLESMRRAVPLLRSDYEMTQATDKFEGFQGQTYGLSLWLPFYGGLSRFGEPYEYRSLLMPQFGMHGQSLPVVKKAYDEFRRVAPVMIEGDYYPLTPYNRAPDQWIAWQFHHPGQDAGILQAFRREKNQQVELATPLRGLNPAGRYRVTHFDAPDSPEEKTGAELMKKGPTLRLAGSRSAGIWEYRRLPEAP